MQKLPIIGLVLAFASQAQANEQSNWRFVSDAQWPGDSTTYVIQIDQASIQKTGTKVRYWVRAVSFADQWPGRKVEQLPPDFVLDKDAEGEAWKNAPKIETDPVDRNNPFAHLIPVRIKVGPSLHESDCSSGMWRLVQGNVIWGYEGPKLQINRPADWQYVAPDSLASAAHLFACKSQR